MSDNIPFVIQAEIIKRLPVKSLVRFTLVSKEWKSLIESPKFIADYHTDHPQHHLLVSYIDPSETDDDPETKYVSIVDDNDSFLQPQFPITAPMSAKLLYKPSLIGSSNGLFLFFSYYDKSPTKKAILWNPSIRKSVDIDVPNVLSNQDSHNVVGFGVSPHTLDPMLVKITLRKYSDDDDDESVSLPVEIFTLSSGVWRSIANGLRRSIGLALHQEVVDEFIYWLADCMYERFWQPQIILSFDMKTEEFTEIYLPDTILSLGSTSHEFYIRKLKESLVVVTYSFEAEGPEYGIWKMMDNGVTKLFVKLFNISTPLAMVGYNFEAAGPEYGVWMMMDDGVTKSLKLFNMMDYGVTKSFANLFNISTPNALISNVLGFRNCGQPIVEIVYDFEWDAVCAYEPDSQHIKFVGVYGKKDVGVHGKRDTIFTSSYVETLLLLDKIVVLSST